MPFFQRKQRVAVREFCHQYFDKWVFGIELPFRDEFDLWGVLMDAIIKQIGEAGVDTTTIDRSLFAGEAYALTLEMFGTAFAQRTCSDSALAVAETAATKTYLTVEHSRKDLWERMHVYNEAVAAANELILGEAMRPTLARMSDDLMERCAKLGAERDCAVRAANRIATGPEFAELGAPRLGFTWATQANIEPIEPVLFHLGASAQGFYNGHLESLKEIEFRP